MCENLKLDAVASSNGVKYCVTAGAPDAERPFGVYAVLEDDLSDAGCAENIFFTKEEAIACCKWLAENNVFPVTLSEVISDLYHMS